MYSSKGHFASPAVTLPLLHCIMWTLINFIYSYYFVLYMQKPTMQAIIRDLTRRKAEAVEAEDFRATPPLPDSFFIPARSGWSF